MLNPPGPVALRAVADAEANTGVKEVGVNAGKAVETYLASVGLTAGAPWCAAYQFYRLTNAAHELGLPLFPHPPRSGYCPDWENWAQDNGIWIPVGDVEIGKTRIMRGDLCLYYFPAKGRVAHMGVVAEVYANILRYTSVEGNTGSGSTVNRDGDGVYRRERTLAMLGAAGGFIRIQS